MRDFATRSQETGEHVNDHAPAPTLYAATWRGFEPFPMSVSRSTRQVRGIPGLPGVSAAAVRMISGSNEGQGWCRRAAAALRDPDGRWVELRGFEPLTPSMRT